MTSTAKKYVVKTEDIWHASGTNVQPNNLPAILESLYWGKVHIGASEPDPKTTGDMWYDDTNELKIYNGAVWVTVIPHDISADVFTGTLESGESFEEAALRIIEEAPSSGPIPGVGDIVIVIDEDSSTNEREMFIITSYDPEAEPQYTITLITTSSAKEITYNNSESGLSGTTVQEAIDELASTVGGLDYDWAEYEYNDTDDEFKLVSGIDVPTDGVRMLKCKIRIYDETSGKVTTGQRNFVVNGTTIVNGSDTTTNYFSSETGTIPLDVEDIEFSYDTTGTEPKFVIGLATGKSVNGTVSIHIEY